MQNDYLPKPAWTQLHQNDVSLLKESVHDCNFTLGFIDYTTRRLSRGMIASIICHVYVTFLCSGLCLSIHTVLKPTSFQPCQGQGSVQCLSRYKALMLVNQTGLCVPSASAPLHWVTVFLVLIVSSMFNWFLKTSAMRRSHGSDRILMGRVNQVKLKESHPLPALKSTQVSWTHISLLLLDDACGAKCITLVLTTSSYRALAGQTCNPEK